VGGAEVAEAIEVRDEEDGEKGDKAELEQRYKDGSGEERGRQGSVGVCENGAVADEVARGGVWGVLRGEGAEEEERGGCRG